MLPAAHISHCSTVIFVNPAASGRRKHACLSHIKQICEQQKIPAEFVFTQSAQDLELRARSAIATGVRVLLAMGGDGTFQGLVNAVFGADVLLGVLPTGGGNDFSSALGLPKNSLGAAQAVLCGEPRTVDLLRARTADGLERFLIAGGGIGLDAEAALHARDTFRRVPGRLRYVAAALCALYGFAAVRVRAEFPGSDLAPIEKTVLLAGALNSPTYGAGLRFAPDAKIDDGWLNAFFVRDLNALEVLSIVPRLLLTGDLPAPYIQQVQARAMKLIPDPPCLFHGDGEIFGPAPVEIEVVPSAIRVLAPPKH
jgi:diacylglycerol kinase (ATP)